LRIIELLTLYLPAVFSILLTRHDQRLGDLAAGTLVIRERFGGRTSNTDAQNPWSSISVRPAAVATWDVSGITPDETQTVGRFLDRRLELPWHIRGYLANELVQRLAPRITGAPENAHPEFVLEGIVVAKHARA
jgi:hypothetical protein